MTTLVNQASSKSLIKIRRLYLFLIVLIGWTLLATIFRGRSTLELPTAENSSFTARLEALAGSIRAGRFENPAFIYFFNPLREIIDGFVQLIRGIFAIPVSGSIIPLIGWLGVIGIVAFIVYASSNARIATLAVVLLLATGFLDMWNFTMDTLAMTLAAVLLSLAIGIPLGIWAGLSDRALAVMRPFLDLAQIVPTLVYLAPLALFFLIGAASATIATMIYSIPIAVRYTSTAIRGINKAPVEAAVSMGSTKMQSLKKVQLPIAKQTIILGVNQTVMAALSFVVIAALIGAPGLGEPVIDALTIRNVGEGFVAGLAVVFLAIMLDRSTSAAVKSAKSFVPPTQKEINARRIKVLLMGIVAIVSVYLSRTYLWAAIWPENLNVYSQVANATNLVVEFATTQLYYLTIGFREFITIGLLNPLQNLLSNAPWFLTVGAIMLFASIIGGWKVSLLSLGLMLGIVYTGLWNDTMITLTQVLVATLLTMILGVTVGVWIGRSEKADAAIRPILDAGQTLPAFVYLIPMLGLFGPSRFTAIATGIVYSIPVVTKIVADGIKNVPKSMIEAAISNGSTSWQVITKVQLPAAKRFLLLAINLGLIYVLAVVIIGAFVGAGGLGYLILLGASKPELQGKGLASGIAILLLGVMVDRIAQAGAKNK
ncbi:MAG: ABC transporter permease [Candidatus Nanopelagicales bacterium]